jgi:hypothetical protein
MAITGAVTPGSGQDPVGQDPTPAAREANGRGTPVQCRKFRDMVVDRLTLPMAERFTGDLGRGHGWLLPGCLGAYASNGASDPRFRAAETMAGVSVRNSVRKGG